MKEFKPTGHELAFKMGRILLENGAEIVRVQETMERVANTFKVENFNVYVLTNAIFANGNEKGELQHTKIKYIPSFSIHFGKIAAINQLSREIATGERNLEQAWDKLLEIEGMSYISLIKQMLACGIGCACFTFMFGGNIFDSLNSLICGIVIQAFLHLAGNRKYSKFITNIAASAIAAFLGLLILKIGLGNNLDKIITGSIIRLVPGIALTSSIRDFFNGDYLSGTIRLIDASIVGGCIAIGVGVVTRLASMLLGGPVI